MRVDHQMVNLPSLSIDNPAAAAAAGEEEEGEVSPFEKFDPLLHFGFTAAANGINESTVAGRTRRARKQKEKKPEVLSMSFVKKYLQYAKNKPPPVLTKGAADYIVNVYATLRNEQAEGYGFERAKEPCEWLRLNFIW